MADLWWITAVIIKQAGTSAEDIVNFKIATPGDKVYPGTTDVQVKWFTKEAAIAFFKERTKLGDTFWTWHQVGTQVYKAKIGLVSDPTRKTASGTPVEWLQTYADGKWNNNLYALPNE